MAITLVVDSVVYDQRSYNSITRSSFRCFYDREPLYGHVLKVLKHEAPFKNEDSRKDGVACVALSPSKESHHSSFSLSVILLIPFDC